MDAAERLLGHADLQRAEPRVVADLARDRLIERLTAGAASGVAAWQVISALIAVACPLPRAPTAALSSPLRTRTSSRTRASGDRQGVRS